MALLCLEKMFALNSSARHRFAVVMGNAFTSIIMFSKEGRELPSCQQFDFLCGVSSVRPFNQRQIRLPQWACILRWQFLLNNEEKQLWCWSHNTFKYSRSTNEHMEKEITVFYTCWLVPHWSNSTKVCLCFCLFVERISHEAFILPASHLVVYS